MLDWQQSFRTHDSVVQGCISLLNDNNSIYKCWLHLNIHYHTVTAVIDLLLPAPSSTPMLPHPSLTIDHFLESGTMYI